MRRIRPVTKLPELAQYIVPEVKIAYIINVLQVSLPLFQNKNPQNPIDTGGVTPDPE